MIELKPTKRMLRCATLNAQILEISLPEDVQIDFFVCWFFNGHCRKMRSPREKDLWLELALCSQLGLEIELSDFDTRQDFDQWFAVIKQEYEISSIFKRDISNHQRDPKGLSKASGKNFAFVLAVRSALRKIARYFRGCK